MTGTDIVVIVGGLAIGYAFVSAMFGKPRNGQSREKPAGQAQPGHANAWSDPPAPPPPAWHAVLGVGVDATLDEVRLAYRRRMAEYHPDKTSQLGDELRQLAERKTVEINAAYREALLAFDARGE